MANKKCPRLCGYFPDNLRKCPKCDSFLLKIKAKENSSSDAAGRTESVTPSDAGGPEKSSSAGASTGHARGGGTTVTPTPPTDPAAAPADYYPLKTPPAASGRVKNLKTTDLKRLLISKVFESLSTGMPLVFNHTVNTFQVFQQDSFGRDISATNVIIRGDIADGDLFEGNLVRVWGKAPDKGSLKAKTVFNVTSGTLVKVNYAIPVFWVWAAVLAVLFCMVAVVLNWEPFVMVIGALFLLIIFYYVAKFALKIIFWRWLLFGRRR